MSSIPIPPIPANFLGAGSQTVSEEDKLEYMEMPTEMSTFDVNSKIYEWDESHDLSQCKTFLEGVHAQMLGFKVENPNLSFVVQGMNDDNLAYFNTLLGEGEVSAIINQKEQTINIQESIFTGFWRITIVDNENNLISDCIEVGDIPEAIVALNQKKSNKILFDSALLPESVINAPAILTELKDKRQEYEASKKTLDAINLTLLPHTEDDLTAINKILGFGDTVILSRGYGNCRITSTGISAIWWVKYFNSTDNEILSTIEITDIPIVACAAQEDIQDSTERLKEFTDEL
ncbi:hydrogenase expression/formation protein [bacterium endosymbiont of Bathymodiolus sp. 5 South]|jgi:hydrogenase-1 operon protein HyaF|uniref:hydrogenase expression/formation protein n=1 Tax=bacterium endosymbiont of Bathymodiolus sp. 5 South TaxID=1181670 RepID=UPI0010B87099|nr:hydrogenase expression/formation protein [bacterium endosymbiont of Bathymodiolus sp. 5 South]VVH56263.1 Hydrogenase maturation factor HoxQ [uncultured Gammaproteobacteria bacterium]SHN91510.1 Hydrogenase maturation factor HoxQ [bacterium endosymbiont of Bathymodiolus sp. 5 South]SSC08458.1 Hydrogenase maturation factor HoxQ [bacterium endosymbiont of Bathymodiolus sp. 5 South]VVH63773.1 Hydrogenase maturation factor HoxQ [uncultured Gammaproteobacteria bacterium]VVM26411.1 Hydrogenase matu